MTDDERVVAACDALKGLADHLAGQLTNEMITADSPTQQVFARQAVLIVRQVHGIAILVGWPYYAEQAGQLVRGLAEVTRVTLWLDVPDDDEERLERAVIFWKDGVRQTRDKYEHQESIGREILAREWELLDKQDKLIAAQEASLGRTVGGLPSAKAMWKGLGREDLYGLFRWDLGGPNQPKDRARRLGAALGFLQLSGAVIVAGLDRDAEAWNKASSDTEALMSDLVGPLLSSH